MSNSFAWEKEYKRTWLTDEVRDTKYKTRTYKYSDKKKGILRYLHILIDVSFNIDKTDYLPSIRTMLTNLLSNFVYKFNEENPISGLSFSIVNDKIIKTSANTENLLNQQGEGYFSLLNGLCSSVEYLSKVNFCKEILVITSSLVLKDSESYTDILKILKTNNIKVNIISLCGELMIYKVITESTGGSLYVPLDLDHLKNILDNFAIPSELKSSTINLIKLGFPKVIYESGVCACHLKMNKCGYECPICKTYICTVPIGCPICEIQLVSSLNISKSFHHMYPLKPFIDGEGVCFCCGNRGNSSCEKCKTVFCNDCNSFVHENLNFCFTCKD